MKATLTLFLLAFANIGVLASEKFSVKLPAQSLNDSLAHLCEDPTISIIYPFDRTRYHMAPALKGEYSLEEAIDALLVNSRFDYRAGENGVYVVFPKSNQTPPQSLTEEPVLPVQIAEEVLTAEPEEVVSIGSRRGEVTLSNSLVAVDVIQGDELVFNGNQQTAEAIRAFAPSFNIPTSTLSDGTDAQRPATLRGLGPDQLLVLVNGKRRHQSALMHTSATVGRGTSGTDLNAIPQAAIKRIEILRDGAAAQYGADAIAGVINIVLNDHTEGGELFLHTGAYAENDGGTASISLSNAHSWQGINRLNYALEIKHREPTDRSQASADCFYIGTCTEQTDGSFVTTDPREINANRRPYRLGDARLDQLGAMISFNHYQSDRSKIYFDIGFSNQSTSAPGFFRRPNQQDRNPTFRFNGEFTNDGQAFQADGFLPIIETESTDVSANTGQIIRFEDWYWDIGVGFGQNSFRYGVEKSHNASLVSFLGSSPSRADAGKLTKQLVTATLDGSRSVRFGTLALGVQLRRDIYKIDAGDPVSYFDYDSIDGQAIGAFDALAGIQVFPGFSPANETDNERDTIAAYSELELSHKRHSAALALRYENVAGIDQQFIQKLSLGQEITEYIKLRASINSGFRAPSMQQQYYSDLSNQFFVRDGQLVPARVATLRNDSSAARVLGVDTLKPERSINTTIGVQATLWGAKFSLDVYQIDISDRITISSVIPQGINTRFDEQLLQQGADLGQLFFNGANTSTQGVDFNVKWRTPFNNGMLKHSISFNNTDTRVDKKLPLGNLNTLDLSEQSESIIEDWQPSNRGIWHLSWQGKRVALSTSTEYIGAYAVQENDGSRQQFSAKTLIHSRAQYLFNNGVELQLGINNVLNTTPDKNRIGQQGAGTIVDGNGNLVVQSEGIFQFSRRTAPFGYNGRYTFLGLRYNFQ